MKQLHKIQREILNKLLFSDGLKYSQIKKDKDMENSKFVFHLDKLIELGYISKIDSKYKLTDLGKEYSNKANVKTGKIAFQSKVTTVLVVRDLTDKKNPRYLIYKRLKNPFYGCIGFPTEKVIWGSDIAQAAKEGLKQETNLESEPKLFAIRHYKVFNKNNELVEDKLMHGFLFDNVNGNLIGSEEGEYYWARESEIKKIKKPLEELSEFFDAVKSFNGKLTFEEISVISENF